MKMWSLGMALWLAAAGAWASEAKIAKVALPSGPEALQRGAETAVGVCLGCHSLKYIKFSDLAGLGFPKEKLDALRGSHAPDEALSSMMPADAAKQAFGVVPPDLSLMAKARVGGQHYVYAFLTGFYTNDKGSPDNKVFSGARMPDILGVASATGEARAAAETKAKEVAVFLEWAGDPNAGERRGLGRYVIAYLVVLTILLYLLKRRTWSKVH